MLETTPVIDILAILVVIASVFLLIYFAGKTLITSNYFQKGINFYQQEDYAGAEAEFRKVIAINSTNDVVRLFLGDVVYQQDRIAEATELFQEVIRRSPKNPEAYLRLANVLMQQNQPEAAKTNLQTAQDLFKKRQPEKAQKVAQLLAKINAKST
ncbi:tetratricopeptide repeat protein [Nostoc spongiaeforme FACHB-130]|uniref:Tetratricopeptide repeat protein n=1 Tax=Nostoc spongiaeforme FACHB-130 TaxID=1357510 RepID=A0ABR8FXI7_9NOSO|nr:tetratricopeptide repeat protein [Nostoc spongiaeforme]MBD2595406.1 tetratricopeptide repeat protein [Nostoc spongiaeforme FACHB-130]